MSTVVIQAGPSVRPIFCFTFLILFILLLPAFSLFLFLFLPKVEILFLSKFIIVSLSLNNA